MRSAPTGGLGVEFDRRNLTTSSVIDGSFMSMPAHGPECGHDDGWSASHYGDSDDIRRRAVWAKRD